MDENKIKIQEIPIDLLKLRNDIVEEIRVISKIYHNNNNNFIDDDARNKTLVLMNMNLTNLLNGALLCKELHFEKFYSENELKLKGDIQSRINNQFNFLNFCTGASIIHCFLDLENFLRIIGKEYGIDNFNVSQLVRELNTYFNFSADFLNLFYILSNIRNSIHNGGFYNHPDKTITYKGKAVNFKKNHPIEGGIFDCVYYLSETAKEIIVPIIEATKSKNYIHHNYTDLYFEP